MLEKVAGAIRSIAFDDDDIAIFLGEYLSEPKPSVVFVPPARPLTRARFLATACRRGVKPARQTRLLYRGRHLFINGESFELRGADRMTLRTLADLRRLDASAVAAASNDVQEALHTWYQDGWLLIG
jgi:50S ribosomal protein L16 3-hydroxylase